MQSNGEHEADAPEPSDNAADGAEELAPGASPSGESAAVVAEGASVAELQDELKRTQDRMLRVAADFENYRRRARREMAEAVRNAENSVVLEFLPVVDNLERALSHVPKTADDSPANDLVNGLTLVHKQFLRTLQQYQVEPFDAVGKPFEPAWHEAIQRRPSSEPKNMILEELQRGYQREGRLVRPSMVIVSDGSDDGAKTDAEEEA